MSENPFTDQGRVGIRLDKDEYTVAPMGSTRIIITLRNQGLEEDRFALAVGGVPASWISASQPVVSLAPGEQKETELTIKAPALDESEIGERTLIIRAASKQNTDQYAELKVKLIVRPEAVLPRVAIDMESTEFLVSPGSSTTFAVMVTNNSLAAETLRLYIDGVPTNWVSTPSPVTDLEPGEQKEISVTISPPRDPESSAGEHAITIRLVSQQNPEQAVTQAGVLEISPFSQFESEVQPDPPIDAGQNAQINITNLGNVSKDFRIDWQDDEELLAFELWQQEGDEVVFKEAQDHAIAVEPGKQETAHFRTGLRKRPVVGGSKRYPFKILVGSSEEDVVTHNSEVSDRGVIPIWVIPVVLVLCVAFACIGVYLYNWYQDSLIPAPEDDSWTRVQEAGVLRAATSADYPPFSYYNSNFEIDGFDAALIRDIGVVLGVDVQVSDYAFEGLADVLSVGQADVAIAAISITPERQEQFGFSNIYYVGLDGILAQADSDFTSVTNTGQMANHRIGVQKDTVYESWAQDVLVGGGLIPQDHLFTYAKPEHAVDDLTQGRLDLVIMDLQPATAALARGGIKLVGQGLNQQRFAIALPKGSEALRGKINEALLVMQNAGRISELAQAYLGLRAEDIIPPPTPEPTPESTATATITPTEDPNTPTPTPCIDAMEFVEDLTYDDEDLTNFPMVDPGEEFQKGWRIRNSGSCSWNGSYYIKFSHGTQMGGQPTSIDGTVNPGQTYDMYIELVAPETPDEYVGYWQMHNSQDKPFGQTIWVAVEVRDLNPETPTVTPSVTPTVTEEPPEPTETEAPPEATATETPPEPTATEEPGADLRDKTWILTGYRADINDENLTEPIPDVDLELIFNEGGTLEGFGGCNSFSGDYQTDGVELTIQDVLATKTTCNQPEGIMEQETAYLTILEEVEEYRINQDDELEFVRTVTEDSQEVEKIILVFSEQE